MADSNSRHAGRKLAIAAAVAALLGTEAHAAPAGSVDFSIANVVATGADSRARALGKGAELNAGDRILTNDGRAQIRFADGAYVSLQPNTDFAIREFRYDGRTDGTERGVFGLLKGAMRTVTGAIGRVNRAAYQIQTCPPRRSESAGPGAGSRCSTMAQPCSKARAASGLSWDRARSK